MEADDSEGCDKVTESKKKREAAKRAQKEVAAVAPKAQTKAEEANRIAFIEISQGTAQELSATIFAMNQEPGAKNDTDFPFERLKDVFTKLPVSVLASRPSLQQEWEVVSLQQSQ